ncbi:MAG: hypothetical protein QXU20_02180 [Candidatus Woesearchaeota archaeon]
MDVGFLISLLLIIVLIFLIFKFVKTLFKAILISILFIFAIFIILALLVYNDVSSMRTLPSKRVMFLFIADNKIQSGFTTIFSKEEFEPLDEKKISELQDFYDGKKYKQMLSNSTKFFVFNEQAIKNSKNKIKIEEFELTNEEILTLLKSSVPISTFANTLVKKGRISEKDRMDFERELLSNTTNSEFKARVFAIVVSETLQSDFSYLIREYKKKNVIVYPKTPLFYLTSIIPEKLTKSFFEKPTNNSSETKR